MAANDFDAETLFSLLDNAHVVSVHNSSPSLRVNGESFCTKAIFSVFLFAARYVCITNSRAVE